MTVDVVFDYDVHRAEELSAQIKLSRGGDEAAALRKLEDGMEKLRSAFKEVKSLAQAAQEAAAKLEVRCAIVWQSRASLSFALRENRCGHWQLLRLYFTGGKNGRDDSCCLCQGCLCRVSGSHRN